MVFNDQHPTAIGAQGAQPQLRSGDTVPPGLTLSFLSTRHSPTPNPEACLLLAAPSRCRGRAWPLQITAHRTEA